MTVAFTSGQSTALATWTMVIVLVLTAFVALRQVGEARRLRSAQTRPFVIVQFDFRDVLVQLVVRNIGRTVARDIRVGFDNKLVSAQWHDRVFEDLPAFRDGIPNLAPDQEVRIHFDHFPRRVEAQLPLQYEATVNYNDHEDRPLRAERFTLDLASYVNAARAQKGIHDLVTELERHRDVMLKWTDGSRGLRVNAIDRDRHARPEQRSFRIATAQELRRTKGLRAALTYLVHEARRRHGWFADT